MLQCVYCDLKSTMNMSSIWYNLDFLDCGRTIVMVLLVLLHFVFTM